MFGIYDDLTPDHVPGLQKYDMCMTEQVPGPQGVKIVGRHMSSAPNRSLVKSEGKVPEDVVFTPHVISLLINGDEQNQSRH